MAEPGSRSLDQAERERHAPGVRVSEPIDPPRPPAAQLLEGLLRGDRRALVRLTRVITGLLARQGAFQLRESWADIVQEVLEAVLESARRGRIRDPDALLGYVATIVHRRVLHWRAQNGRRPTPADPLDLAESVRLHALPDLALQVDLSRALQDLPASLRQVLRETYCLGHTYGETAARLGLSQRQVKRLQSRGLALLRRSLGTELSPTDD